MWTGIPFLQISAFQNLGCHWLTSGILTVKEAKGMVTTSLRTDFSFHVIRWEEYYQSYTFSWKTWVKCSIAGSILKVFPKNMTDL